MRRRSRGRSDLIVRRRSRSAPIGTMRRCRRWWATCHGPTSAIMT